MNKKKIIIIVAVVILAILILLPSPSIAKQIHNDSNFSYSTSITGKYSSSNRANIYSTDMDVPNTAKYIMDQKRPQHYTDLTNEESIQLTYDDYYVLVYKGEDLKTYVQTSSRKFIHRNGYHGLYRPYRRNIIVFYDRSYRSGKYYSADSKRYGGGYFKGVSSSKSINGNKIKTNNNNSSKIRTNNSNSGSIRNGSSGTRTSIGGGTSFGK